MSRTRTNAVLNSNRPLVIVVMLLAALLLVVALAWQAWQMQKSHQATADSVLREYGILAADEFSRRAVVQLGYQGYYRLISQFGGQKTASAMMFEVNGDPGLSAIADLVKTWFVYHDDDYEFQGPPPTLAVTDLLRKMVQEPVDTTAPYQSARTADKAEQVIISRRLNQDQSPEIAGFVVNNPGIGSQLDAVFEADALLPASLAGGKVNNQMLFLRVTDPAGVVLLEKNPGFDSRLAVSKIMGDDYQGILRDFLIEVSLDPEAAPALVIGGLPRSRVPLLLAAMVFVLILLLSAIWLFRREQAIMKLRSDFISQVSHELRTPLTQIRMFAETLLMDRARNDEERQRSLEIINRESQRLSHLVDNILQYSNGAEPQPANLREQNLAPIVAEVCRIVENTSDGCSIVLSLDHAAAARVDPDALRQIVLNLLDNAIKYGPADQQIEVSLMMTDDKVRLAVEDQGPGIPSSERVNVMSAFYRLSREDETAISGTGIGLAVVRELTESMGGRCLIESGNVGARFCIELERASGE